MTVPRTGGLALLCDRAGVIRETLCGVGSAAGALAPGQALFDWVDSGSRAKLSHLLAEVQAHRAAFDWELNVSDGATVLPWHVSAIATGSDLLFVAASHRDGMLPLYEELMRINNEQVNALRQVIKDQTAQARHPRDDGLLDEMSRLNNELIDLQRELAKKNVELEHLNRQKNQFLGMAAHDLRNPLSAILTYSEFLMQDIGPLFNAEQKEFLAIIRTSSQFMRRLVDNWLDVSAIEAGQFELNLEPTDLDALVGHNVALNRVMARQIERQVTYVCADEIPRVWVDRDKIEQVLNNLLSNAVKYSPPASVIQVGLQRDGEWLVLTVQDHGQGIPAADMERLFKMFGTTSAKSLTGEKSTGLGLAIARKVVAAHQGKIWVESQVGQGSTFYVAVPVTGNQEYFHD